MIRKLILVLSLFLVGHFLMAQTAVLMPLPRYFAVDATGAPLVNGCVFTYAAGTNTPLATYTTASGAVTNANPAILDTDGSASIWLSTGIAYKIVLFSAGSPANSTCSNGSLIWTQDNVTGIATQTPNAIAASTVVPYSATPTFTSLAQNQLFQITLTGDVTSSTLVMTGLTAPALVQLEIQQDATGGRTFAWPVNVGGAAPVGLVANSTTVQQFVWDGTTAYAVSGHVSVSRVMAQMNTCSMASPCAVAQFTLSPNTSYSFSCDGYWNGDTAGGAAYQFLMGVTSGSTAIGGGIRMWTSNAGASADNYVVGTGTTALTESATLSATGNQFEFTVVGNLTTNGNTQTLQLTFNKVTGGGNGMIFVGTQCKLYQ